MNMTKNRQGRGGAQSFQGWSVAFFCVFLMLADQQSGYANLDVGGNLTVSGTATMNGNTTIGTSGVTDTIIRGNATMINSSTTTISGTANTFNGTTLSSITGGSSSITLNNANASMTAAGGAAGYSTSATPRTLPTSQADLTTALNGAGTSGSRAAIAGGSYVNRIEGDTLVNGNLLVNGSISHASDAATVYSVSNGETSSTLSLVSKGTGATHATVDKRGNISLSSDAAPQSAASLTLTDSTGNTRGVVMTEEQLAISGGNRSAALIFDDQGATFRDAATGSPARVTGVADGVSDYDAVNYRQLDAVRQDVHSLEVNMSSGIAMAGALAAIPQIDTDNSFALGIGAGHYNGESALAIGGSLQPLRSSVVKVGMAVNGSKEGMVHAGASYFW